MKVAVVHNRDRSGVINVLEIQNNETYDPTTVEAVANALESAGHTVRVIDGNMHVIEQLRDFMPGVVAGERPGMVFNMAYGIQGVSRYTHLPGMLEMLGVPYVGSGPQAHSLALDKVIAKILFDSEGIPTPRFWNFATPEDHFDDLVFPAIVKPKMEAMSSGIRIVHDEEECRAAVAEIIKAFNQHVLVEQFVAGREFTVGLLGNDDVEALPVVELDMEGDPMGIRADEARRPRRKVCPAELPPEKLGELQDISRRAFRALGLSDFGRVDLRMDERGTPYVLEINSMADLGQTGAYVHSAEVAGYSYESLINRVLNVAAARYFGADYGAAETGARRGKVGDVLDVRVRGFLRSQATTIEDSLGKLAETRKPAAVLESVEAQLRPLGLRPAPTDRTPDDESLFLLSNHAEARNDVLLVASLEGDAPQKASPWRQEGNRIYGADVAGGTGGLAVLVAALRALRFARRLRRVRVGVLICLGSGPRHGRSRRELERTLRHSDHVLGVSPGEPTGSVVVSRAGCARYRVELTHPRGRSARALSPAKAVETLTRRVAAVHRLSRPESGVAVGLPRLYVAAAPDALPDEAFAELTVLFTDPGKGKALNEKVHKLLAEGTGARLHVSGGVEYPPMAESEGNRRLLAEAERIGKAIHATVHGAASWSPSPLCYLPDGVPALDGLGPWGGRGGDDDWIRRDSLLDRAALLALLTASVAERP